MSTRLLKSPVSLLPMIKASLLTRATGKYWIPVYNNLEKDCSIVLAHPKYVKAIRTRKMPNGLLTCLNTTLLPEALCRLLTSASSATLCATVSN